MSETQTATLRSRLFGARSWASRSSSSASSHGQSGTVSTSGESREHRFSRMVSRIFTGVIFLALVTVWGGVAITYGAKAEAWLNPPIQREISRASRTELELSIYLQGEKLRDCPATLIAAQWVLASGVVPVVMTRPDRSVVGTGALGNFQAGDDFLLGPYTVRIPQAALTDSGAEFRVATVYQCHFLWPITVSSSIVLADVPLEYLQ